jgi:hypothetical protein
MPSLHRIAIFLLATVGLFGQAMPRMVAVEPMAGKAGTEITVNGEGLSKENVVKVFLSDGKTDTEIKVAVQEETVIKFTIPGSLKPGRYGIAVQTKAGQIIDQPVKVTVEE